MAKSSKSQSYIVVGESQLVSRGTNDYQLVTGETIEVSDPDDAAALIDSQLIAESE